MSVKAFTLLIYLAVFMTSLFSLFPGEICAEKTSPEMYKRYCAPCHGVKGDGKGFNAKNLDPRPANHTDIKLMSKRTDEDLYDVIDGGGRAVGKSTLMPPWGNTFSGARIESLVLYMRKLCRCKVSDALQ